MEKTKKLLTRLSQNCVIWLMADKDSERGKKTVEFQKEIEDCIEEINNCVSGSYFTALEDARKMLQESLSLKEQKWRNNQGSVDEHEEYWINENRINRCKEAIPFLERLAEVK